MDLFVIRTVSTPRPMNIIDKFKLLIRLNTAIGSTTKEIKTMDFKSGWKTSEFWGKVAVQATTLWAAVGGFVPPKYAVIVVAVAEGIYTIARTVLKMNETIQASKAMQTTVTTNQPVTTVTTPT